MTGWLTRLQGVAVRRPALTLGLLAVLALAGGALATRLRPSTSTSTFVSASSAPYRATVDEQRRFGEDAVVVLIRAPLSELLEPARLATLTRLEACLDGHTVDYSSTLRADVPANGTPIGGADGPCGALARSRPALVVYGPGTFLNRAVAAVGAGIASQVSGARAAAERAASAAYRLARARGASVRSALADASAARELEELRALARLEQSASGSGLSTVPSVRSEAFLRRIVFGTGGTGASPRPQFAYLFPNADAAIVQVRLRESLSAAAQARAIRLIRAAVAMPQFAPPPGASAVVTGVPVVLTDLAGQITGAIGALLVAAAVVMAIALLLVFRPGGDRRLGLRLLPLLVAVAASGITFGLLSLAGVSLTLASVAVAPVLIGLGVDYSVQFQSRAADDGERHGARAAPAIVTAALATGVGFLVLLLSPVPMVRGFGLLLVLGVVVALVCTLLAVPAVLALADRDGRRSDGAVAASLRGAVELVGLVVSPPAAAVRGAAEIVGAGGRALAPSLRGAADLLRLPRDPDRVLRGVVHHPGRVLAVGVVLAAAGWAVDGSTPVQSDVTRLVPQSTASIRHLRALEATTGTSGEIDVTVRGADVATPATIAWMRAYQSGLLRHFGYGTDGSCARATLCPALSLPDLFGTSTGGGDGGLTQARIDALLAAVPGYFSSAVLTSDRREAELAFGIRLMPLARQQRVIEYMRAHLHPPAGVDAALTGLPVLAAQADADLSSPGRRLEEIAVGLVAVALVLLLLLRRPRRALVPMIPIVLATGWSALVLYLLGIPLNPMSATLGALVIAVSTEFSVLLSERFAEERAAGGDAVEALRRTYRSTGRAVITSGITAIAGFGVLVVSDIAMLRDFGLVTLVDLTVSLAGVLIVLPAALALGPRPGTAEATSSGRPASPRARWA